ncbi:hypothetical protein BEN49_13990 [Hymenobacter coccineus]|uniref:Uncharacterized protein n=1 Tax=Hymenobacter coccineus TaxID=1908235 RepID=A0A1G1SUY1_9BACT|nr:hypothetical protein BEN49_13990 [Hymenobacter coccineus]
MLVASLLAWWAQASPLARHPARAWPLVPNALAVADAAHYAPADTIYKPSRRPRVGGRDARAALWASRGASRRWCCRCRPT